MDITCNEQTIIIYSHFTSHPWYNKEEGVRCSCCVTNIPVPFQFVLFSPLEPLAKCFIIILFI